MVADSLHGNLYIRTNTHTHTYTHIQINCMSNGRSSPILYHSQSLLIPIFIHSLIPPSLPLLSYPTITSSSLLPHHHFFSTISSSPLLPHHHLLSTFMKATTRSLKCLIRKPKSSKDFHSCTLSRETQRSSGRC